MAKIKRSIDITITTQRDILKCSTKCCYAHNDIYGKVNDCLLFYTLINLTTGHRCNKCVKQFGTGETK